MTKNSRYVIMAVEMILIFFIGSLVWISAYVCISGDCSQSGFASQHPALYYVAVLMVSTMILSGIFHYQDEYLIGY
ncbi:TPA: hypothetical protein DDW69_03900 [candidate division CPR2 bacterium]|uniref:Uncharacterized protein n=1 Tax=candidate division CPR2 bacterium GW2011_GWC1_41_48 TaxID=1618344 RepID=A0A0G0YHC9_UNCC2|nr:MAG: hypothetical protein UT47_C0003G0032 [candidate division CPR2 bacterium GW2011_GWC2_39_35]KKR27421.1 MAG: hypothetical protein UT59_C0057G0002 [candidate division CPR2 bacterium GW2011_GWD1_39_7]KKR28606.1 MAG: hypothetical protein UT60_C0016G0006 [candidate division CPR2 bacterium GW2011_GWD2_39_7]KKS08971.1 MAG: hypothetical protein UU65_C0003G0026 [candidate division CPR2 bacterium GW2011_GWC1_41_48]OGB58769.1 MAG: hypothetical protein A2Y27_03790 [candidate division CPR2 bacterium G